MNDNIFAIVIPCYNEEDRINSNIFLDFCKNHQNIVLYFVNDGSTDKTFKIISTLSEQSDNIYTIDNQKNKGKAETIRETMLTLQKKDYEWIGFLDVDLATPLSEIYNMIMYVQKHSTLKMIMGSRFQRLGSNIQRRIFRFYLGRFFASIASYLLNTNVYDTQCGAKLFHRDIITICFKNPFISKWIFDMEIIFRLLKRYDKETVSKIAFEYPLLEWYEIKGSKIQLMDFFTVWIDLIRIWIFYKKNNSRNE